jgi:hypothetical protein
MVDTELLHKLMFEDSGLYVILYRSNIGITTEHTSPAEH